MATTNIADKPLGGRIDPAHNSRRVEHVARNTDTSESLLDIAADCKTSNHDGECCGPLGHRCEIVAPMASASAHQLTGQVCARDSFPRIEPPAQRSRVGAGPEGDEAPSPSPVPTCRGGAP